MGALKILRQGWSTYDQADGLGESVASVFQNRAGELYVNSSQWRVSRFDGQRFTTVKPAFPATLTSSGWRTVSGMLVDHTGQWWFATREGLYRFGRVDRFEQLAGAQPIAIYQARDGLVDDDVTRLFEDSRGDIWIASWVPAREVLVRWDRATATFHRYGEKEGLRPFVTGLTFAEDAAGNVWAGFREGVSPVIETAASRWSRPLTASEPAVSTASMPTRRVVSGSRSTAAASGASTILGGSAAHRAIHEGRGVDHGLGPRPDRRPRRTHLHHGPRGIDRLDPVSGRVKHYSTADGFAGGEFTAATHDRSGALWFCTTAGLSRLIPAGEERRLAATHPDWRVARRRDRSTALPRRGAGVPTSPESESEQHPDFFALAFRAGETLRYQHRLEGASADWSAPAARRSVDFASLSPGTYQFLVRAVTTGEPRAPRPPPSCSRFCRRYGGAGGSLRWPPRLARPRSWRSRGRATGVRPLRESEDRFRTLAETASDAIITIDDTGRIVLVNHAVEKVFGYRREELLGAELTMLMPASFRARHEAGFARYQRTGQRNIAWETIAVPGRQQRGTRFRWRSPSASSPGTTAGSSPASPAT